MDRAIDFLRDTAAQFHVHFVEAEKPKNGALSEVYFLDGKYVLRSRPMAVAEERLKEEVSLLEAVSKLTKLQFPILRKAQDGTHSILAGDARWTLYEKIPGSVLGTWTDLPATSATDKRAVLKMLRAIHDGTRGKLSQPARPLAYVERLRETLQRHRKLLSPHAQSRLELALQRAASMASGLPKMELCFVHGDIHQGNAIVDEAKTIRGVVDCDDARIGHAFEDAGFTTMMYLRGYESDSFLFHEDWYKTLLQSYGVPAEKQSLFADYLLLGTLFDVDTFAQGMHIQRHEWFLQYQLSMVHDLCSRFVDTREAMKAGPAAMPKFPVKLPDASLRVVSELRIDPKDVSERFVRGSGHGGQKINKTSSCVELHHEPSGVSVRVQEYREQHKNRIRAWKLLIDKIEEQMKGAESKRSREMFKIKKQKARRSRKSKEKMLQDKKKRADVKKARQKSGTSE